MVLEKLLLNDENHLVEIQRNGTKEAFTKLSISATIRSSACVCTDLGTTLGAKEFSSLK